MCRDEPDFDIERLLGMPFVDPFLEFPQGLHGDAVCLTLVKEEHALARRDEHPDHAALEHVFEIVEVRPYAA